MSKEYLEALERLAMPDEIHISECKKLGISPTQDYKIIEQALQRLEAIDNAKPSEALECWNYIKAIIPEWARKKDEKHPDILEPIKQALIKAQENEKDKVLLKNLHNTKVKVPLVHIFNGLSWEKKFAYTEHIYYHWEELKESLEAEIKAIKDEKENLESKTKKQEKVLKIIFEKNVDIGLLKRSENWLDYYTRVKHKTGKDTELTEEEFNSLKRWLK